MVDCQRKLAALAARSSSSDIADFERGLDVLDGLRLCAERAAARLGRGFRRARARAADSWGITLTRASTPTGCAPSWPNSSSESADFAAENFERAQLCSH